MLPDHQIITPSILYFGTPVVLIVTTNPDGSANITPVSSAWALGSTVVLGLGLSGQGAMNLLRERECSLNFPSAQQWPQVEKIAKTTGVSAVPAEKAQIGYIHETDKFALGGFTRRQSDLIRPPCIEECPLQFETHLLACHQSAREQENASAAHLIMEVEVHRVHAHRNIVIPGTNHIDTGQWNPLFYVFRHYFGNADDLGHTFRAEY